ncbi:hypothetical protein [Actinopolymorpha pittospori]|uniref:Uncharacterized protein n=1 Tax=Actinopolymorpha pittospori TaxID=648752 RepID=A0A927MWY4_9ACTN|nr:hypothetical protein [Actinopolymorpha pittospori]MBE1604827.1 hypothetical protein [Actinopolymorpha pittospori]
MSMYGSWIITHAPGAISATQAVADLQRSLEVDLDLQDWPTGAGWSGAFSRECLTGVWNAEDRDVAVLTGFTQALAIELGGQVAAGWSEDGAMFAGCLSTATSPASRLDPPLLLGFGLVEDRLEAFAWGDPYLARLRRQYGSTDWQTASARHHGLAPPDRPDGRRGRRPRGTRRGLRRRRRRTQRLAELTG